MTGVEILAMEEVAVAFGFCWAGFICLASAGLIFGAFLYLGYESIPATLFIIVFALGAALLVGFNAEGVPTEYETQYKVTVSDEVPMNEFLERYEIINQEGKVYLIRERDDYVEPETKEPTEKTGYWTGWEGAECSECGQFNVMVYSGKHLNYCPDCGTKMDGGNENG